jgi:TonB family protein
VEESLHYELVLLPDRRLDSRLLLAGYGFLFFLIATLIGFPLILQERLELSKKFHLTEIIPRPDLLPEAAPKPPEIKKVLPPVAMEMPTVVAETAKILVPHELERVKPKPEIVKPPELAPPPVQAAEFKLPTATPRMPRTVQSVDLGGTVQPTLKAAVQQVQTGAFGDPNGIAGKGKSNAPTTAASTGAFDLPQGAAGVKAQKGTVASVGFGNGIVQGAAGRPTGQLQTGGFEAQQVAQKTKRMDDGPPTSAVQITFKPTPVYTDEAKQMRLEGEVLIEIMFGANGQLHVNRVIRGLGHGLDESAIAAARQMRFHPALRDGVPVDSTSIVHVTFQMAY